MPVETFKSSEVSVARLTEKNPSDILFILLFEVAQDFQKRKRDLYVYYDEEAYRKG